MDTVLNNNVLDKPSKLMKITPYIFFFFIFSFIGWLIETIFCYLTLGVIIERGFLNAPICPIYRNWSNYLNPLYRKT